MSLDLYRTVICGVRAGLTAAPGLPHPHGRRGLLPACLFAGVFLLAGANNSGRSIGLLALLLDVAP